MDNIQLERLIGSFIIIVVFKGEENQTRAGLWWLSVIIGKFLCFICRVQDLRDLGELSPHWDNLRKEVMTRYGGIISSYQETLTELDKITGMSASFVTYDHLQ